jgi:protein involved in polysaccharide export with SLBB domain
MTSRRIQYSITLCGIGLILTAVSGCHSISNVRNTVPANRLPPEVLGELRESKGPIQFAALGQEKPAEHIVGPGDRLSVYVFGVFPPTEAQGTPLVQRTQNVNQRYYPPRGSIVGPATGLPVVVSSDGTIELPSIGQFTAAGLTIPEMVSGLKQAYIDAKIVEEGREQVSVSLLIPRVTRVTVIREDTPTENVALVSPGQVDHIHRGSGEVIDLPAYENDVLHALTVTGGLPGTDAAREVWVFRRKGLRNPTAVIPQDLDVIRTGYANGETCNCENVIRIPLALCGGQPMPFSEQDVVLEEGDVVFVPRRSEYFYLGGLLKGARIPLPRDEDIDVLEAIALATGSVGGPLGQSGNALLGGAPGYLINPTRAVILRKLPEGEQLAIRVDIARAAHDKKQRIIMQPDDVLMLHFKPHEAVANGVLNFVSLSFITGTN